MALNEPVFLNFATAEFSADEWNRAIMDRQVGSTERRFR